MSILYEELCITWLSLTFYFLFAKVLKTSETLTSQKYVVAMVVTASKTIKSYVINQLHCQRLNFTFL